MTFSEPRFVLQSVCLLHLISRVLTMVSALLWNKQFEEYLCSLLSSMKYADYLTKVPNADPLITGGGSNRESSYPTTSSFPAHMS